MCDAYPPAERGFNFQKTPFFRLSPKPEVKCILTRFNAFQNVLFMTVYNTFNIGKTAKK